MAKLCGLSGTEAVPHTFPMLGADDLLPEPLHLRGQELCVDLVAESEQWAQRREERVMFSHPSVLPRRAAPDYREGEKSVI